MAHFYRRSARPKDSVAKLMRAGLVSMVGAERMPGQPDDAPLEVRAAAIGLVLRPALNIYLSWVCDTLLPFRVVPEAGYTIG